MNNVLATLNNNNISINVSEIDERKNFIQICLNRVNRTKNLVDIFQNNFNSGRTSYQFFTDGSLKPTQSFSIMGVR